MKSSTKQLLLAIIYQDAHDFLKTYNQYHRYEGIFSRHELALTPIIEIE